MNEKLEKVFNRPIDKVVYGNLVLRSLSAAEIKRLNKLLKIFENLESGKTVQNRQLEVWLNSSQYAAMHADWQHEVQSRHDRYGEKPASLIEYERRLNKALFSFNRAESYSSKKRSVSAKKLYYKAEDLFENALEYLREVIGMDPSLSHWLDRDVDPESLSISPSGMPRLRTSRSLENNSKINKRTIRDCKIHAVRLAIAEIVYEKNVNQFNKKQSKLMSILNSIDDDNDE